MFVSWWALDDNGAYVAPLPDHVSWALSPVIHSPGAVQLDYPRDGRHFDLLRDNVSADRDLYVAAWTDGQAGNAKHAILNTSDGDDIAESAVWRFTGNFLPIRLEEAVVWPRTTVVTPPTGPAPTTDLAALRVYNATAGSIMATLMQEAHGRGTLTDIGYDFTPTLDSFGTAWSLHTTLKIAPGTTLLKVAQQLAEAGMCSWDVIWTPAGRRLVMWETGTRGVDRTAGPSPLILRAGRDLLDAPRKHTVRPSGTALLAVGADGLYHDEEDLTARARRGRRIERAASQGSITDAGTLMAYAQNRLPAVTAGQMEVGHGIAVLPEGRRPGVDYDVADWVWSDTGHGLEKLQLAQLTLRGNDDGLVTAGASLNDLIASSLEQLAQRVDDIEGGSTVTGTSSAPPGEDGPPDTMPPAAPTGLVAESIAYQDLDHTQTLANVTVTWGEVITNQDGTAADDLAGYKVRYAYLGLSQVGGIPSSNPGETLLVYNEVTPPEGISGTTYTFAGVEAGANIGIQVAAFDRSGNTSAWSTALGHDTAVDDTPPPIPSTPVVTPYLGQLRVAWDGLGSAGETMPRDLERVEVHVDPADNFTPTDATLVDAFSTVAGERVITDRPYDVTLFVRLVAVDRSGNRSDPSAVGSGTPSAIGYADIAFSQVGNLVEDGSFETVSGRERHAARSDAAWSFVEGGADHGDWYARGQGAVGSGIRPLWVSGLLPAVEGQQFVWRLAARRTAAANGSLLVRVRFHLNNGSSTDLQVTYTSAETADTWLSKTASYYTCPAATVAIELSAALAADCTAGEWWIDRAEVREAIGTLLIQNAAITDAKIQTLSVGKLTAGTLSVAVTNAGIIRSGTTGQRYELDASALKFYDAAGTQTIGLDGVTNFIAGTLQSALSGARWVMHPDGTLRLYPPSGTNYSQIANAGNDVVWRGPLDANSRSGRLNVNALGVGMNFSRESDLDNLRGEVLVLENQVGLTAPNISFRLNGRQAGAGGIRWVAFFQTDSSGQPIAGTRIEYKVVSGAGGFVGIAGDSGWKSEAATFVVCSASMTAFRPVNASAFNVSSSEATKEQVEDARALINPLDVIRQARARKYVYTADTVHTPPPTEENPDPQPVPVTDPPVRVGPLAEELPAALVSMGPTPDGTGETPIVNLADLIGTIWGALGQIQDQQLVSTSATAIVPAGTVLPAGATIEVPVTWESSPPAPPTGGAALINSGVAWAGRVTAWLKTDSVTATGAIVVFKNLSAQTVVVTANGATAISASVIGQGLYTPPFIPPQEP